MAQTILLDAVSAIGASATTYTVTNPATFIMEGKGSVRIEKQKIAGGAWKEYKPNGEVIHLNEKHQEINIIGKGTYRVNLTSIRTGPITVAVED